MKSREQIFLLKSSNRTGFTGVQIRESFNQTLTLADNPVFVQVQKENLKMEQSLDHQ